MAVALSLLMRPKRLYLVGHDLVCIENRSHSSYSEEAASTSHVRDTSNASNTIHRPLQMVCNDGKKRDSTLFWSGCRMDIETLIAQGPKPAPEIINLSSMGAVIAC
jgi:hypothetical protein